MQIRQSQISCKKRTVSLAHNFQCKRIWKNKLCLTIGDFNSASGQLSSLQSSCKRQVRKGQGKTKEQLKTPLTSIKRSPQKLFMIISPAKMWTSKLKRRTSLRKRFRSISRNLNILSRKKGFSHEIPLTLPTIAYCAFHRWISRGLSKKDPKFKTTLTSRLDTFTAKNRVAILYSWIFKCCC